MLLPQPEGPMNAVMLSFWMGILRVADCLESAVIQLADVAIDHDVLSRAVGGGSGRASRLRIHGLGHGKILLRFAALRERSGR